MDPDATWAEEEFGEADLGDVRRNARLVQLASVLGAQPSASLPDATDDPAALKAAYRFFANDYVRAEAMLASHVQSTTQRMQTVPLVLAVQDTTYLDWTDHPHTTGLGPLTTAKQQGLLAHSTLTITPERVPLGLLQQQVWARDPATFAQLLDHKQRPIAEKESQKWLTSLDAVIAARADCPTTQFVSVGDREADVYDLFLVARPPGVDLLVRAAQDRKADQPEKYLWAAMASAPIAATVTIHMGARAGQVARDATVTVRWRQVTLRPPNRRDKEKLPTITVWAVWACETTPPPGVTPVEWLLLTTVPILTTDDALERLAWYAARWGIEIVFSQVTKADVSTSIGRRNNVPDFHLVVGDNHTIDQQFDQLTSLGKAGLLQSALELRTDGLDVGDGLANLQQLLTVVGQLPLLHLQIVALLDQLALAALKLGQLNRLRQIGGQQALALAVETPQRGLDSRPAMVEFIGEPSATVGALQGRRDQVRMLDHRAQILPHQGIQLNGRNPACRTADIVATGHRPLFAITEIVEIVRRPKAAMALQTTLPTADQIAQQVVMPRTALRHLLVGSQPSLDSLKQLLADNRWHFHSNPLVGRGEAPTDPSTDRLEWGFAALGRAGLHPITIGGARITGIQQDEADGIRRPVGRTGGRRQLPCGQTERELVQAEPAIGIALEQLLDNRRLTAINCQERRIARAFGVQAIAIRCPGPGEQVTSA